jgi:tRNA 5-methylaminomethyl-2-thiouridine biosynthesis bifunctional protein
MSNNHPQKIIKAAQLKWLGNMPLSTVYEDCYFSLKNSLEEIRYVYLAQNQLPQRWLTQAIDKNSSPFTIVETGFGTGLNFLLAWQAWEKLTEPKQAFSFISIEKYPFTKEDLARSLKNWPELGVLSQQLIQQYPYLVQGSHLLSFNDGKVKLQLIFDDVNRSLETYSFSADCWFLESFLPSKNPSMWTDSLFNLMANTSHSQTTFSSFYTVSSVRKDLANVGFDVQKATGFGGKRDMIFGKFKQLNTTTFFQKTLSNWTSPEPAQQLKGKGKGKGKNQKNTTYYDAIIIGAGLAGITTAAAFAEKGLKVALIDQRDRPVSGASGQSQLALYVKLPTEINKTSDFISHCTFFSQRYFDEKQNQYPNDSFWNKTGLLQLAWNEKEQERHNKFLQNNYYPSKFVRGVSGHEASKISGLNIDSNGLWFENSGWLEPTTFAKVSLESPLISFFTQTKINNITRLETEKLWSAVIKTESEKEGSKTQTNFQAEYLIIANSNDAKHFEQLQHIPSKPLKGQVTSIYSESLKPSKTILCGEGYLCPPINNWHHFGATFDLDNVDEKTYPAGDLKNVASIHKWLPAWLPDNIDTNKLTEENKLTSNTGLRCTTPDYMPIVGRVPIYDEMLNRFAGLRKDAKSCKNIYGSYYPNLFINIGHGSKGLVTTPIAAELLSALVTGSPNPFNVSQSTIIAPARFIIRHLKQGKI